MADVAALQDKAREHAHDADRFETIVAAARDRPELEQQLMKARESEAKLPGLEKATATASTRATLAVNRDRLRGELVDAEDLHVRARETAVCALERHAELLQLRLDCIAAELAQHLADGQPCGVCGSLEHPAPAVAHEDGLVSGEAVADASESAATAMATRDAARDVAAALHSELAGARAIAGEDPVEALHARAEAAAQTFAAARQIAASAESAQAALAGLDAVRENAVGCRRNAEVAAGEAAASARQRAEALRDDRAAVATARGEADCIAQRVAHLTVAAELADDAATGLDAAASCEAELSVAASRAAAAAHQAGFADVAGLSAAVRDTAACRTLEQEIRSWDDGLAERHGAAARPELAAVAERPAPDVHALEAVAQQSRADAEESQRAIALAERRYTELESLRDVLVDAVASAGPAQAQFAAVRELADLAAGTSASNRLRMRLSAYVLAARLEEVAAAATLRLQVMSGGRYALEHADDTARGRSRGGLDLRVIDGWTGRDRSPASLSGGETFVASLALALGLADVVSAEAGGVGLETLFIDEGFGSLDDEGTLDEVLEVLDGLRDGGRTVGIISHVAELRQRIATQVRVERLRGGSRVMPMRTSAGSGLMTGTPGMDTVTR